VIARLERMLEMPSIKEFTEEAFAYFFSEVKNLENSKPLSTQ